MQKVNKFKLGQVSQEQNQSDCVCIRSVSQFTVHTSPFLSLPLQGSQSCAHLVSPPTLKHFLGSGSYKQITHLIKHKKFYCHVALQSASSFAHVVQSTDSRKNISM